MAEKKLKHKCGFGGNYGFIRSSDGKDTYNINSCCGGCYATDPITYCPQCGRKLKYKDMEAFE